MTAIVGRPQDIQVGHSRDLPEQASDAETGLLAEMKQTISDDLWKASIFCGLGQGHAKNRFAMSRRDLGFHGAIVEQDRRRNVDSGTV